MAGIARGRLQEERKTWRSSEVAEVADGELVSEERKALDRQEEIAELSLEERMAKAEEGKAAGTALFKQQQWAAAAHRDLATQPACMKQAATRATRRPLDAFPNL